MAVTIEPLGGLGNQLFVYGAGLALAQRLGLKLQVDNRNYRDYDWHDFELSSFKNDLLLTTNASDANSVAVSLEAMPLFEEDSSRFDERFMDISAAVRLRGYFQSWKYLQPVREQLIHEIQAIRNPSDWYVENYEKLKKAGDWTAIHVRMGNYLSLPHIGVVSNSYFARSTALMDDLIGDTNFVLFSDDIPGALEMLKPISLNIIEVVDSPQGVAPIETLNLMATAKHFIIANSTFSWWAAWIGSGKRSHVIAPRPWLVGDRHDDRDILPSDWIALGRV